MTLKDLAVDHDYYCSDVNYFKNSVSTEFTTFSEFYEEFFDADPDMNLVFRWDIIKYENDTYRMEVLIIHQRKGFFRPIMIDRVFEEDVSDILEFLNKNYSKLQKIWNPISST